METPKDPDFVVGVSIARTNDEHSASAEEGIEDYRASLERLVTAGVGDFYTVNISCPNVHGGESFAEPQLLRRLLESLCEVERCQPMYAKMPIDLPDEEFDDLVAIVAEFGLQVVVIGNLCKDYDALEFREEAPAEYGGGVSGRPCFQPSNRLIRRTRERFGDQLTIIGCGGVLSPKDAMEKLRAGADLVQLVTGMIFEGPHLMKGIAQAYARQRASDSGATASAHGARTHDFA